MTRQDHDKNRFAGRFSNLQPGPDQQELDRMWRQHLWEQQEMERMRAMMEAAQKFGDAGMQSSSAGGVNVELPGLVINSADFTSGGAIYQDTTALGSGGVDGFENTAAQGNFYEGYYGQGLTPEAVDRITAAYVDAGLDPENSTGYIWNATWGSGSTITTGLIKFGFYAPGAYFDIQTVDPADPDWESPGVNNGTTLVGTFLFPLRISIYTPLINKGGWC